MKDLKIGTQVCMGRQDEVHLHYKAWRGGERPEKAQAQRAGQQEAKGLVEARRLRGVENLEEGRF